MAFRRPKIASFVFVGFLIFFSLGFYFRQNIFDWYRLYSYKPSSEIAQIAKKTSMTDKGRQYFYVMHPVISNKEDFNQKCRQDMPTEFSIILGCYIRNDGIYLYKVVDQRLNGIIEVTAAHEMLHSAYDRMSESEKEKVNQMLLSAYSKIDNQRIIKTVEQYSKQDPSSTPNELHSILGTEVSQLPNELENYYKKYFTDRKKITDLSSGYESEFSSRQAKAEQIQNQLNIIKSKYENNLKTAQSYRNQLIEDKKTLERLLQSQSTDQYNSLVDSYNQKVNEYNQLVRQITNQIDVYNNLVKEYQNNSLEINNLYESIDSRPSEI